jgi:hypothetical protein
MPTNPSIAPLAPHEATLDEKPAKPADDPLDPIEGATTRMTMPPEPAPASAISAVETQAHEPVETADLPDSPTETRPQAEERSPEPEADEWRDEAGARTWKPPSEMMPEERGAETDLDLSQRALMLREANAETKPFIEKPVEEISLVPPERVLVESSPAAAIPQPAEAEMMPEEATVADDPSLTMKGPLLDESPTWSPGQVAKPSLPPRMVIPRYSTASQEISVQPIIPKTLTPVPFVAPKPIEPERAVAARRAKTQIDDAALVEAAFGSNQRYVITACFAILGLLAGIAAALFS